MNIPRFIFCLFLGFVLISISISVIPTVSAIDVSTIYVKTPSSTPVAPWDKLYFYINITDNQATKIESVTLFYATDEMQPKNFKSISMNLTDGNSFNGTWDCTIPPTQENGTILFYYAEVIDFNGVDHSRSTYNNLSFIPIEVYERRFTISEFSIEEIHETELTVDIRITFDVYFPPEESIVKIDMKNGDNRLASIIIEHEEYLGRFIFQKEVKFEGLELKGNPEQFPFDSYLLNLTFTAPFTDGSMDFLQENVSIPVAEEFNWIQNTTIETKKEFSGSSINYSLEFQRKNDFINYYFYPIITFAFVLGITLLLPSDKYISHRLTVHLALFVFGWQYGNTLRSSVPTIAIGVTSVEILTMFLSYFTGIFIITTFLEKFWSDLKPKMMFQMPFDTIGLLMVSLVFFFYPVITLYPVEKTLFNFIPFFYSVIIFMGLSFGWIIRFLGMLLKDKEPKKPDDVQKRLTNSISTIIAGAIVVFMSIILSYFVAELIENLFPFSFEVKISDQVTIDSFGAILPLLIFGAFVFYLIIKKKLKVTLNVWDFLSIFLFSIPFSSLIFFIINFSTAIANLESMRVNYAIIGLIAGTFTIFRMAGRGLFKQIFLAIKNQEYEISKLKKLFQSVFLAFSYGSMSVLGYDLICMILVIFNSNEVIRIGAKGTVDGILLAGISSSITVISWFVSMKLIKLLGKEKTCP